MISASTFAARSAVLRSIPCARPTVSTVSTTPSATPAPLIAVRRGRCLTFSRTRLSMCQKCPAALRRRGVCGLEHVGPLVEVHDRQVLLVVEVEDVGQDLTIDRKRFRLKDHVDRVAVLDALDRDSLGPLPSAL